MSNPARKRHYREALRYTRWRPRRRVTVICGGTPATLTTAGGLTLTLSRWTLTLETRPGSAFRPPPVLEPVGPYEATWET